MTGSEVAIMNVSDGDNQTESEFPYSFGDQLSLFSYYAFCYFQFYWPPC